ncbi:hypothetical protein [Lyngbya sp. CCY1209]|uniref:hypothetical protein n=1 Tax=Lyngbya sp. CCY1209 TaxID=2886103 RepID=UPI002D201C6D|nr:hypothetical protein [Lyngbya sp. CCY1209]MEB3882917.1 hypothetical protein [Lyngbya sp. CCY1209]
MNTWFIYALGGGWGHLNRTLSLGRVAATRRVRILTNSPYWLKMRELPSDFKGEVDWIAADTADIRGQIREQLLGDRYSCLIVDTFPRGLGGELVEVLSRRSDFKRVLIHRDLNPDYVRRDDLISFVAEHFDLILIPGEGENLPFANLPQVRSTEPWLSRNSWELPDRATARSQLGLAAKTANKTVLILASGRAEELNFYGEVTVRLAGQKNLDVRCISAIQPPNCPPELWRFHYPAFEYFVAADVVVGSGGYNTVYECQALGIPLVSRPFRRLYDRQLQRLNRIVGDPRRSPAIIVGDADMAVEAVAALLPLALPRNLRYENGAIAAVEAIEELDNREGERTT